HGRHVVVVDDHTPARRQLDALDGLGLDGRLRAARHGSAPVFSARALGVALALLAGAPALLGLEALLRLRLLLRRLLLGAAGPEGEDAGEDRAVLLADLRLVEDGAALEALAAEDALDLEAEVPRLVERLGLDLVDAREPLGRVALAARADDEPHPQSAGRGPPEGAGVGLEEARREAPFAQGLLEEGARLA